MKINLFDSCFSHANSSVAGQKSKYIIWNRNEPDYTCYSMYTNENALIQPNNPNMSFAWLLESKEYIPHIYAEIRRYIDNFKYIFTSDRYLLKTYPQKCKFSPSGGIWVGGTQGQGEIKQYEKTKFCSLVCSLKAMCRNHEMRIQLAQLLHTKIDVMGDLTGKHIQIIDSLADYHYSIIIENHIDKWYFTEKLLNCFSTFTLPLYFGATDLGKYFNTDGVIQFSSVDECMSIIHRLTPDLYYTKMEAMKDNFKRCQEFLVIEDYIYEHYLKDNHD